VDIDRAPRACAEGASKRVSMRYGFTREPSGSAYQELLEFCGSRCIVATLVIRELDWLEEDAIAVMERLRPFQIEIAERSEWAGTRLIEHTATVYTYGVDEALVNALQTLASGLYAWQQPHRPEDLVRLRSNGDPRWCQSRLSGMATWTSGTRDRGAGEVLSGRRTGVHPSRERSAGYSQWEGSLYPDRWAVSPAADSVT
jgi:hypothetical protein